MRYFSVITLFFLSSVAAFSSNVIDDPEIRCGGAESAHAVRRHAHRG